jgi:hypothetical protein
MSSGTLRSRLVVFIGLAAIGVLAPVAYASGKPKHHKVNQRPIVIRSATSPPRGMP